MTEPKSAHSRRTIPLAAPAAEALRTQRREQLSSTPNPHGLVFARPDGRPVDGTALTRAFQAALKAAEVPSIRWHDLRHYTASLLLSEGVPMAVVSSLLGHSGIGVTVDTYGHLSEQSKREAVDRIAASIG